METLIKKLKEHRISVTPQRLAILQAILKRYDHPSADSLYQEVRRTLPMISFNTVYKTLETFCQKGLVVKINPLHEAARYDGNVRPHGHLVCTRCNRIEDVAWEWPQDLPFPDNLGTHFKIQRVSLQFLGLCARCQGELVSQTTAKRATAGGQF